MAFCSECGKPFQSGAKFCTSCGSAIAAEGRVAAATNHSNLEVSRAISTDLRTPRLRVTPDARLAISKTIFVLPQSLLASFRNWLEQNTLSPVSLVTAAEPIEIRERAQAVLKKNKGGVSYICLLGVWADVPPFVVANPVKDELGEAEIDTHCLTDAPYGCFDSPENIFDYIGQVPVGRIPSTDMKVIERALLVEPTSLDQGREFSLVVSASCWQEATQAIIAELSQSQLPPSMAPVGKPLNSGSTDILPSPDWEEQDINKAFENKSLPEGAWILFNVHGGADEPEWVGDSGGHFHMPTVFVPGTVNDYNNALFFTEACYGGALGYSSQSMVEHFFANGGKAFVGCSVVAYGSSTSDLSAADVMALAYLRLVKQGLCFGEALSKAKVEVIDQCHPIELPVAEKTLLSFNLFGVPWSRYKAGVKRPQSMRPQTGSTLERVRQRMVSNVEAEDGSSSSIVRARAAYLSRLSHDRRQFIMDRQDAMRRLSGFQDRHEIISEFSRWGIDEASLGMQYVETENEDGFFIFGHKNKAGIKSTVVVITDGEGKKIQTLISKNGVKHEMQSM